jgi:hypothetical protein
MGSKGSRCVAVSGNLNRSEKSTSWLAGVVEMVPAEPEFGLPFGDGNADLHWPHGPCRLL